MKKILAAVAIIGFGATVAFANCGQKGHNGMGMKGDMPFKEVKHMVVQHEIDKQERHLKTLKCVIGAKTKEALKMCKSKKGGHGMGMGKHKGQKGPGCENKESCPVKGIKIMKHEKGQKGPGCDKGPKGPGCNKH